MARQSIEIPDAVFEVEVDSQLIDSSAWVYEYSVNIAVGRTTVFSRTYHDDDARYDDGYYVYELEEAREKALTAFGERLRDLLQDD